MINSFKTKPDWVSQAFPGATHLIRKNNMIEEQRTYHFAEEGVSGYFAEEGVLGYYAENGQLFTDFEVIEESPWVTGSGVANKPDAPFISYPKRPSWDLAPEGHNILMMKIQSAEAYTFARILNNKFVAGHTILHENVWNNIDKKPVDMLLTIEGVSPFKGATHVMKLKTKEQTSDRPLFIFAEFLDGKYYNEQESEISDAFDIFGDISEATYKKSLEWQNINPITEEEMEFINSREVNGTVASRTMCKNDRCINGVISTVNGYCAKHQPSIVRSEIDIRPAIDAINKFSKSIEIAREELLAENKYNRVIIGLDGVSTVVDVYCVQDAFPTTDPRLQHLQKKALAAGLRGHKSYRQDLVDIQDSVTKAIAAYDRKNNHE